MIRYTQISLLIFLVMFIFWPKKFGSGNSLISLMLGLMVVWGAWLLLQVYIPPYNPYGV